MRKVQAYQTPIAEVTLLAKEDVVCASVMSVDNTTIGDDIIVVWKG